MQSSGRRGLTALMLTVGATLLVAVTLTRPLAILRWPAQVSSRPAASTATTAPDSTSWDYWTGTGEPQQVSAAVAVVSIGLLGLGLLLAAVVIIRAGRRSLATIRAGVPTAAPLATSWNRVRAADRLDTAVGRSLAELSAGDVAEGIIGCWRSVEEVGQRSGLPRSAAETSEEYAVALLTALELRPEPVRRLAALFREARFSDHPLSESDRQDARDALLDIRHDLSLSHAAGPTHG